MKKVVFCLFSGYPLVPIPMARGKRHMQHVMAPQPEPRTSNNPFCTGFPVLVSFVWKPKNLKIV